MFDSYYLTNGLEVSHSSCTTRQQWRRRPAPFCLARSVSLFRRTLSGIKSDALNHSHSKKLLHLLALVTDDRQRLALYEDVEEALLEGGSKKAMREAAGLLAVNLAERMDRLGRRDSDPAVQETFLRHSIRTFPESPVASRSLGYKLEQTGRELEAMDIYREGLARSNTERLDLRLLLASCCPPFLDDGLQGDIRCRVQKM